MDASNVKNKARDNKLTSKGPFRQPRQDYLQDSVSQCNNVADKESLCKVSEYEISLHSKFNLPNIRRSDGRGRAIYWLYKHNLADSQSVREKSEMQNSQTNKNKLYAIDNFIGNMQDARENPESVIKRLRLRRDLCKLRELFLKGEHSEIEIKETYNSYLNLDDIYSLHLYLKSNEPLCKDQYRNLALNLEIKRDLLKKIQEAKRKGKEEYVLPKVSRTNAQKNQRLQLENYISKFKAASKTPCKNDSLVIYPFRRKSKPDQKQNTQLEGAKVTNILTRSGLGIGDLEHILNQINFIIKGEHFDQETEMQKAILQRYLHSISTESNISEAKKEKNLCILDKKISEGMQNSMRDLIRQLAYKSKTSSLKTESSSSRMNADVTSGSNSLRKSRAKSNILVESSSMESTKGPPKSKRDLPLACFKCESSENSSSDENLYSDICMKNRALCSLGQHHRGDALKEFELAAKRISQDLAQIRRKQSQGDSSTIERHLLTKKESEVKANNQKKNGLTSLPPETNQTNNHTGDVMVSGRKEDGNRAKAVKRRNQNSTAKQSEKGKLLLGRTQEGEECTQQEEHTNLEDTGQQTDVKQDYFNSKLLGNRHTSSQTDHRERHREEASNTEDFLSFVDFKQKQKVDSAEQYRIQDVEQSCKGPNSFYKDQLTQYQAPKKNVDVKGRIQVTSSKVKDHHVIRKHEREVSEKTGKQDNHKSQGKPEEYGKTPEGKRYVQISQRYKKYLRRIHETGLNEDKGEEIYSFAAQKVNGQQHKNRDVKIKEDLNYLCFEDELRISSNSLCDRAKTKASVKLQLQRQGAPNEPPEQQAESLDDLIERAEETRALKSKTWAEIQPIRSEFPSKGNNPDKKLMKSYREDISNKMARSYDYFISSKKKRISEDSMEEDPEEVIDKIDYENYISGSEEKYLVHRIAANSSHDVFKQQSKRKILQTIDEKENVEHRHKRNNSRSVSKNVNVDDDDVSKYQSRRNVAGVFSKRENIDSDDDDLKYGNQRSSPRNVNGRDVDDDFKYQNKRSVPRNLSEREDVDDLRHRSKKIILQHRSERENMDSEDCFEYTNRRNTSRNLNDDIKYQSRIISDSSMKDSSTITENSTNTMTNSENLYIKSTNDFMGRSRSNQMNSDISGCSISSLERFILDERACAVYSGNVEANSHLPDIPIYKGSCKIARLRQGSKKINKSTQMFEHVTQNDLYTLQWIHDNLFEININPHTLIVDEKIKEVSEESRLS